MRLDSYVERQIMAGWIWSATSASGESSSPKQVLADRRLWKKLEGGNGSILLKNSLISEKAGLAEKLDVHNCSVFDDLVPGKVLAYPGKTRF